MNHIRSILLIILVGIVLIGVRHVDADFTFGEPTNLGPTVNSIYDESVVCLSPDNLEMYFISDRVGGSGSWDLWVTKRATPDGDWNSPQNLGPMFNSDGFEGGADMSHDGLTLYFTSEQAGGVGSTDIWKTTRINKNAPWTTPVNLGAPVNSVYHEECAAITEDGLEFYFCSLYRPGGVDNTDIWTSTRDSVEESWSEPNNLGSVVNTMHRDEYFWLSSDGLTLLFDSDRPDGFGLFDLWITRRASRGDPWTIPVNLGSPVNSPDHEALGAVSPDGRVLYFVSSRVGNIGGSWGDIWQIPILPVVDFNSDGIVDAADMTILIV